MSIRRDTIYNLVGSCASIIVTLATVPLYLETIGEARYGVLTIVWLFTGYFGLFDLGLSRAAAYHIVRQNSRPARERTSTFWTATWLNLCFGVLGALVLYGAATLVFASSFKIPAALRSEVIVSLPWVAASLPLATMNSVLVGAMQARQRFALVNLLGTLNVVLTQIIPLAVARVDGPNLKFLIPAVVVARFVGVVPSFAGVWRILPLTRAPLFDRVSAGVLLSYGGWVTISNFVGPILVTLDRIVIGTLLSARAVAYYTVPYNVVTRLWIIPSAMSSSLFPLLAGSDRTAADHLAERGVITLSAVLTLCAVTGIVALPIFLRVWISPEFSDHAAMTGMILIIGVWISGIAFVPSALLQAQNRPDLTAKLHLVELPPFLLILWAAIRWFGLEGAAVAWTLRNGSDALLLLLVTRQGLIVRLLPFPIALMIFAVAVAPVAVMSVGALLSAALVALTFAWAMWIAPDLRAFIASQCWKAFSLLRR